MKRFLRYFRSRRFDDDLRAEMQAHLDEKADELMAEGASPRDARAAARRRFGNQTWLQERCRERWSFALADELLQDLRYTIRMLRRNPAFSAVAVLSLALGIGANSVIFSTVDGVLLRSLPYPHAGRLFAMWSRSASHGAENMHVSPADFYDWRAQSHAFESLAAYASWPMNLTDVDEPRRLETELVSASLFQALGSRAQLGRTFAPDEDQEQSAPVVVISHHLWRALGEPPVAGHRLTLNGSLYTVIGVMPVAFAFPSRHTDAWVPLSLDAKNRASREGRWLQVIGRLRSGATPRDAAAEMDVIASRLAAAYPATNAGWSVTLVPLQEELVGKTRPILLTLQACGLLLLLITCANLANLLLARGAARGHEIGMRTALGAGRARVLRQLMVESAALAVLGGVLGLALASRGIALVRTAGEGLIPRAAGISLSAPVVWFALVATAATVLIFGLAPALHVSRADLRAPIGSGARGTPRNVEHKRGVLVAVEIALSAVLLVATGLLARSLIRLLAVAPGLRTDHMLTMTLTLPHAKYPSNAAQAAFFQQVLDRANTLPGVTAAAEISDTPLEGNNPTFEFVIEGAVRSPSAPPVQAGLRVISAGYLRAAGIPLIRGRAFTSGDRAGAMPVAIVNETMAQRYWPSADPVRRTLRLKDEPHWITVVGVVPDVKHMGLKTHEGPVIYIPYAQKTQEWLAWTTLLLRTTSDPLSVAPATRAMIRSLDRNQPVGAIGTLNETLNRSTALPRFSAAVTGAVSGLALLIAVIGVYGLLAYTVAQRRPELGIRLTLGASPARMSWLLLRQAMLRSIAGIAGGLVAAWWLSRGMASLLFEVRPHDPVTFAAVAVALIIASLAAVAWPVRRATKIDPMAALRAE